MGSVNSEPEFEEREKEKKKEANHSADKDAMLPFSGKPSLMQSKIDPFLFSSMSKNNQATSRSRENCSAMNSMVQPTHPEILKLLQTELQCTNYLPEDSLGIAIADGAPPIIPPPVRHSDGAIQISSPNHLRVAGICCSGRHFAGVLYLSSLAGCEPVRYEFRFGNRSMCCADTVRSG